MKIIYYYNYAELLAAAIAPQASQEDVNALGEWFSLYGESCWNGEYYDASALWEPSGYRRLYPVEQWDDEAGHGEVIGYEFR